MRALTWARLQTTPPNSSLVITNRTPPLGFSSVPIPARVTGSWRGTVGPRLGALGATLTAGSRLS